VDNPAPASAVARVSRPAAAAGKRRPGWNRDECGAAVL